MGGRNLDGDVGVLPSVKDVMKTSPGERRIYYHLFSGSISWYVAADTGKENSFFGYVCDENGSRYGWTFVDFNEEVRNLSSGDEIFSNPEWVLRKAEDVASIVDAGLEKTID